MVLALGIGLDDSESKSRTPGNTTSVRFFHPVILSFTSITLADENRNWDTRIQLFLVQFQLAPAACEGAHTSSIRHNIMCPGARLHTYTTHLPYHTITQQNYLLTGRSPRRLVIGRRIGGASRKYLSMLAANSTIRW